MLRLHFPQGSYTQLKELAVLDVLKHWQTDCHPYFEDDGTTRKGGLTLTSPTAQFNRQIKEGV
ncbi:hypothetical protein GMA8713_03853 [Grimontia marina]|uniref:Uncharacterized protein n=1 Tax=Grimontia marina TaxID=646534 RepID=A0A128FGY5_9GAMM|nr:hypothetical protein GMA8713_03853 [Grimontia marina]